MYGLNSSPSLRALLTAAAQSYPIRLRHLNPPLGFFAFTHSFSADGTDDFVYVGKGCKIYGEGEIESDTCNKYEWKFSQRKNKHNCEKVLRSRNVVRLTCESAADGGICNVYLLGTNHICKKSEGEAQALVKFLKPQVVFLELCSSRLRFLTLQKDKVPSIGEMLDSWKKTEDPSSILYNWFLAKTENCTPTSTPGGECRVAYRVGGEFHVAYQEALKYGGKVILGDRPIKITVWRMLAKMSLWKLLFLPHVPGHLTKTAKDDVDVANLDNREMSRKFPDYTETFVYERDRYMSAKILKVARKHNSVVAIVGRAHLAGIQKNWKQPVDMKQLLDPGKKFTVGKTLSCIGAMFFYLSISERTTEKIMYFLSSVYFGKPNRI